MRQVVPQRCASVQGHIFCNFPALYLKIALQNKLREKGLQLRWDEVLTDLDAFKAVHFQWDDRDYLFRTASQGRAHSVFQAA